MKTTILTILLLAVSSLGFAQVNPVDFEAGGIGSDWTWNVFENADNPPVDVIFNPDQSGINTSDSVASIISRAGGASFAGATTFDLGAFTIDETNSTISIMVWKSKISDVGLKLETNSTFAFPEIKVANTVTNEWEELTFDFSGVGNPPSEDWTGITIFPDFGERTEDHTTYFDNLTFSEEQNNGGGGGPQTEVFSEQFVDAASIDGWTQAGDAAGRPEEVTFEWDETAGVDGTGAMRFGGTNANGEGGRAYIIEKVFTDVDFGGSTSATVSVKVKSEALVGTNLAILTEIGSSLQQNTNTLPDLSDSEFVTFTFEHPSISASANSVKFQFNVAAGADVDLGGTVLIDDLSVTVADGDGGDGELITNGDFEAGRAPWTDTAGEIRTEGGNSYFFADVATAGEAFNVNLSQNVSITPSETYTLTFEASTSAGNTRTMIVGIGESQNPFRSNTETITLTETLETYTLELAAINADGDDAPFVGQSRVLFDMGAATGIVVIDNVSLQQGVITSNENDDELPSEYVLNQNYPNPFNPTTNISFSLPQAEQVSIKVYDMLGREVATLVNQQRFGAGAHQVTFDAANLASGIYIYRLQAGTASFTKKMTLIK